jgi:GNAT superfamily N-acetyltransferase
LELKIQRVHHKAWDLFKEHHYLNKGINPAAVCFVAFLNDRPVAFSAWLQFFGKLKAKQAHRVVVLPDFQGLGIANIMTEYLSSMWHVLGFTVFFRSSHPAEIKKRRDSPLWKLTRQGRSSVDSSEHKSGKRIHAVNRLTCGFRYAPTPAELKITALEAEQLYSKS